MKTFEQWLSERGARTRLGIYPALYGAGQYPPLYAAPTSASHMLAFALIHGGEHEDLLSEPIKKAWKKNKDKAPDTMGKKKKKKSKKSKKDD